MSLIPSLDTFRRLRGRLTHFKDGKRTDKKVVTCTYWLDRESDTIFYGAAMFHPDDEDPVFNKYVRRDQTLYALERLFLTPVITPDPFQGHIGSDVDAARRKHIRRLIANPEYGMYDEFNTDSRLLLRMAATLE